MRVRVRPRASRTCVKPGPPAASPHPCPCCAPVAPACPCPPPRLLPCPGGHGRSTNRWPSGTWNAQSPEIVTPSASNSPFLEQRGEKERKIREDTISIGVWLAAKRLELATCRGGGAPANADEDGLPARHLRTRATARGLTHCSTPALPFPFPAAWLDQETQVPRGSSD